MKTTCRIQYVLYCMYCRIQLLFGYFRISSQNVKKTGGQTLVLNQMDESKSLILFLVGSDIQMSATAMAFSEFI